MKLFKKLILICLLILPLLLTISCNPFASDADDDSYPLLTQEAYEIFYDIVTLAFDEYSLADKYFTSGDWVVTDNSDSRHVTNVNLGIDCTFYDTENYIDRTYLILNECDISGTILTGTLETFDLMNDITEEDTYNVIGSFSVANGGCSSISFNYLVVDDYETDVALSISGTITIDGTTYDAKNAMDF